MTDNSKKGLAGAVVTLVTTVAVVLGLRTTTVVPTGTWDPAKAYEIPATQTIRFTHTKPVSDGWSVPKSLDNVLEASKKQLVDHKGDGYKMKREGGEFGAKLNLNTVMRRLPDKLDSLPLSTKWVIRCLLDGHLVKINKVDVNPFKIYDTQGTHSIDIIVGTIIQEFPTLRSAGICVCKKISGSYTWSQHAYCNAVDLVDTTARLDQLYEYLRRSGLPYSEILWRVPNHYGHMHISGYPKSPDGLQAC